MADPLQTLRHHVTGAIERGEAVAIEGKPMTKLDRFGRPIRPYVPMRTRNAKGEDHGQFVARVKPHNPCNSLHETFGGKCLNCGFQPTQGEPNHGTH